MSRTLPALAGIYARYSSDNQRRTSTEDQLRNGRAFAEREGWPVVAEYADQEVSGSVPIEARAAGAEMLRDARARRFSVLVIESLDRLSRDLVDQERMVRRLEHAGIRILATAENYDSLDDDRETMRQIRGTFNERLLREIGKKVHRGLDGQLTRGYHAGGLSYGYRSEVAGYDGKGEPIGHHLRVAPEEAEVVRGIFARFAAGWSCQKIAHDLNARAVPAPRGGTWAVSALYGSPAKGSGILNNELYAGRHIWNRSRWVKDPDTRRRIRLDRPREEWKVLARPDLAIVPEELWAAVRARMARPRTAGGTRGKGQAPRTLFGGLVSCGLCGGAVVAVNTRLYGCAARKDRGTPVCAGVLVPRADLEARLLSLLRDDLASPDALAEVQAEVAHLVGKARREAARAGAGARARLAELEREIGHLVDAVARSGLTGALQERLEAAEGERARLRAAPRADAVPERLEGVLAAYRAKLVDLRGALGQDVPRARELLQDALGPVRLVPEGKEVYAEVESRADRLLVAAGGLSLGVVAGSRSGSRRRIRIR